MKEISQNNIEEICKPVPRTLNENTFETIIKIRKGRGCTTGEAIKAELEKSTWQEHTVKTPPINQSLSLRQKLWRGLKTVACLGFRLINPMTYLRFTARILKTAKKKLTKQSKR